MQVLQAGRRVLLHYGENSTSIGLSRRSESCQWQDKDLVAGNIGRKSIRGGSLLIADGVRASCKSMLRRESDLVED
jgi:hypothetical protein